VQIIGYVSKVQDVGLPEGSVDHDTVSEEMVAANIARCPHEPTAEAMIVRFVVCLSILTSTWILILPSLAYRSSFNSPETHRRDQENRQ